MSEIKTQQISQSLVNKLLTSNNSADAVDTNSILELIKSLQGEVSSIDKGLSKTESRITELETSQGDTDNDALINYTKSLFTNMQAEKQNLMSEIANAKKAIDDSSLEAQASGLASEQESFAESSASSFKSILNDEKSNILDEVSASPEKKETLTRFYSALKEVAQEGKDFWQEEAKFWKDTKARLGTNGKDPVKTNQQLDLIIQLETQISNLFGTANTSEKTRLKQELAIAKRELG